MGMVDCSKEGKLGLRRAHNSSDIDRHRWDVRTASDEGGSLLLGLEEEGLAQDFFQLIRMVEGGGGMRLLDRFTRG